MICDIKLTFYIKHLELKPHARLDATWLYVLDSQLPITGIL